MGEEARSEKLSESCVNLNKSVKGFARHEQSPAEIKALVLPPRRSESA